MKLSSGKEMGGRWGIGGDVGDWWGEGGGETREINQN